MHTYSDNGTTYDVDKLIKIAESLSTINMPTEDLESQLKYKVWDTDETEDANISPLDAYESKDTSDKACEHYGRAMSTDLNLPIIYDEENKTVVDGMHRLLKAYLLKEITIKAKVFKNLPEETIIKRSLYKRIKNLLDTNKIEYNEQHHEPVFTSAEAAAVRGTTLSHGAKALIFWADGLPVQIVIQGDKRVDKDKFKALFGFSKLKMVSAEEVEQISSAKPGAVPPFGPLFDSPVKIYCTENLAKLDELEFNAGDHGISMRMKTSDWIKLINPIIGDFEIS